jgi:hypothetical protein
MASLGKTYVAGDVDTTQKDFEDLPAGIMQFEIEATDVVETGPEGARTGVGLKYTANVLAPEEVSGRKFFGFINLENKNPTAQEIGQREFASLRRACGIDQIDDTEELHFRTYTVKLGLGRPSKDGKYPARMEVKRYFFPDENNVPEPSIDAQQPAAVAQRPANDNRPAAANNNKPAQPAKAAGSRPWSK